MSAPTETRLRTRHCTDREVQGQEYPAIAAIARTENADIYLGDETRVSNRENYECGFAEKGHPPVLPLPTKKDRGTVDMITAVTGKGQMRFMVY